MNSETPNVDDLLKQYSARLITLRFLQRMYDDFPTKENRFAVDDAMDAVCLIEAKLHGLGYFDGMFAQWRAGQPIMPDA